MSKAPDTQGETFPRPSGPVDAQYLGVTAALLQAAKQRTYDLMQVQPGHQVLDLGCGPATDTLALARLVGPSGRVIGIDHDPAMVALASQRAQEASVSAWTTHVQAEATSVPLASGSCDSVRAERVLQHLPEPRRAFAELVRVTKPGGWLVVAEPDWGTLSIATTETDLERRYVRFQADRCLQHGYVGRDLYGYARGYHLSDVVLEIVPVHFTSFAVCRYIISMDEVASAATGAGVLSQEEMERLRADLERSEAEGCFFASAHGVIVAGRKP